MNVDVAGADRAYHDITIVPRRAKALTIPIHAAAYGKRAADIDGLFKPKNMNILAVAMSGQLVPMFALCKRAFQRQDPTLLPTDGTFAENISNRWWRSFCVQLDNEVTDIP